MDERSWLYEIVLANNPETDYNEICDLDTIDLIDMCGF
jgi:hypothetical protein